MLVSTSKVRGRIRTDGTAVRCEGNCLHEVECVVDIVVKQEQEHLPVPRCEADTFTDPGDGTCGEICPCWRVIQSDSCQGVCESDQQCATGTCLREPGQDHGRCSIPQLSSLR